MSFSFRWGIDLFDKKNFTEIPNFILKYYHKIPWKQGEKSGVGISNTEMMFIIHLSSFKYETENGKACPALTSTLRERMNYSSNQGIINVEQGLIEKGLLIVRKRPGNTSLYDFAPLSKKIMAIAIKEGEFDEFLESSTKLDDLPEESSTKLDDRSSTKLDLKKKNTRRRKEGEEEKSTPPKNSPINDPVADIVEFAKQGVSEASGSNPEDQYWENRDGFLKVYQDSTGQIPIQVEKEAIIKLASIEGANLEIWRKSITTAILNWAGSKRTPPLQRMVEIYEHGQGDWEKFRRWKWPQDNGGSGNGGNRQKTPEQEAVLAKLKKEEPLTRTEMEIFTSYQKECGQ